MLSCQYQTVIVNRGVVGGQLLSKASGFAGGSRSVPAAGGGVSGDEAASVQPLRAGAAGYSHGCADPAREAVSDLHGLYSGADQPFQKI